MNADVLLTDNSVSRSHAKITLADGKTVLEDAGSSNGTFVDGIRSNRESSRANGWRGAEVRRLRLTLSLSMGEGEAPAEPLTGPLGRPRFPPSRLSNLPGRAILLPSRMSSRSPSFRPKSPHPLRRSWPDSSASDETSGDYAVVSGDNTVGRRPDNMIAVTGDAYVSGSHAVVSGSEEGCRITDVGSSTARS